MIENPLVSVIIPTYNRANYLIDALDSVSSQTYDRVEVIIVDDGSTDHSAEIVRAYPTARYFYQANQGVSVARNVGIAAAQGELIAFLDADDYWQPDKLRQQVAYMLEHPTVSITATHVLNFLEPGTRPPEWFKVERHLGESSEIIPSTLVVRKSVFEQIGGFSPKYRASEDTEWLARAKDAQISIVTIPATLTFRRLHGNNLSWMTAATWASRGFKLLKASIDRKKLLKE